MNRRILLAAFLFCCAFVTHAQTYPKPELSLSSNLDIFPDDFKTAYKPGSTHILSLGVSDRHKRKRHAWGINLGYGMYHPKGDTVYSEDGDFQERYYYGKYRTLSAAFWGRWDFVVSDHVEISVGIEAGYHFTAYDYTSVSAYGGFVDSDNVHDNRLAAAPLIGFGIPLNRFSIFAQSRYIFSYSGGSFGIDDGVNRILSTGIGVRYRFERPYKKQEAEKPVSTKPTITYD